MRPSDGRLNSYPRQWEELSMGTRSLKTTPHRPTANSGRLTSCMQPFKMRCDRPKLTARVPPWGRRARRWLNHHRPQQGRLLALVCGHARLLCLCHLHAHGRRRGRSAASARRPPRPCRPEVAVGRSGWSRPPSALRCSPPGVLCLCSVSTGGDPWTYCPEGSYCRPTPGACSRRASPRRCSWQYCSNVPRFGLHRQHAPQRPQRGLLPSREHA